MKLRKNLWSIEISSEYSLKTVEIKHYLRHFADAGWYGAMPQCLRSGVPAVAQNSYLQYSYLI